jgi:hypothetical protein
VAQHKEFIEKLIEMLKHLQSQPVTQLPPSFGYKFRGFGNPSFSIDDPIDLVLFVSVLTLASIKLYVPPVSSFDTTTSERNMSSLVWFNDCHFSHIIQTIITHNY